MLTRNTLTIACRNQSTLVCPQTEEKPIPSLSKTSNCTENIANSQIQLFRFRCVHLVVCQLSSVWCVGSHVVHQRTFGHVHVQIAHHQQTHTGQQESNAQTQNFVRLAKVENGWLLCAVKTRPIIRRKRWKLPNLWTFMIGNLLLKKGQI